MFAMPAVLIYIATKCACVPFSTYSHQHLLFLVFLITAILIYMWWYLIVLLVCISLMINDIEHLFTHACESQVLSPVIG